MMGANLKGRQTGMARKAARGSSCPTANLDDLPRSRLGPVDERSGAPASLSPGDALLAILSAVVAWLGPRVNSARSSSVSTLMTIHTWLPSVIITGTYTPHCMM